MISEAGDVSAYDDQYLEWISHATEDDVVGNFDERIFRNDSNITTLSKNVALHTTANKIEVRTKKAFLTSPIDKI